MPERENRREQMLEAATELFMKHGYSATSVRQIAAAVGCTESALYYHFKGGKHELLQQVIAFITPNLHSSTGQLAGAASLPDLIIRYGKAASGVRGGRLYQTLHRLLSELDQLTPEERASFYTPFLNFQSELAQLVEPFVSDPDQANEIAWLLLCMSFGYRRIFYDLEVDSLAHIEVTRLFELIAKGFDTP